MPKHRQPLTRWKRTALVFMGALVVLPMLAVLVTALFGTPSHTTDATTAKPSATATGPAVHHVTAPAAHKPAAHKPTAHAHAHKITTEAVASVTVRAGNTLWGIAVSHHVTGGWQHLYQLNKHTIGSNPNLIQPGMRLLL